MAVGYGPWHGIVDFIYMLRNGFGGMRQNAPVRDVEPDGKMHPFRKIHIREKSSQLHNKTLHNLQQHKVNFDSDPILPAIRLVKTTPVVYGCT